MEENKETPERLECLSIRIAPYILIIASLFNIFFSIMWTKNKHFPYTSDVQRGYVVPSKLEIKLDDLDNDGKKEVIMNYDKKSYLLTLDKQGNPKIQKYKVNPAEIVKY